MININLYWDSLLSEAKGQKLSPSIHPNTLFLVVVRRILKNHAGRSVRMVGSLENVYHLWVDLDVCMFWRWARNRSSRLFSFYSMQLHVYLARPPWWRITGLSILQLKNEIVLVDFSLWILLVSHRSHSACHTPIFSKWFYINQTLPWYSFEPFKQNDKFPLCQTHSAAWIRLKYQQTMFSISHYDSYMIYLNSEVP